MDISSKYFSSLRVFNQHWLKNFICFLCAAHKTGKLTELLSFIWWEINHRFYIYALFEKYVRFTKHDYTSISTDRPDVIDTHIYSQALSEDQLCFELIQVDWKRCIVGNDGTIWGYLNSAPESFFCSVDGSKSVILIYKFPALITSFFVSNDSTLFVCCMGRIYRSNDKGRTFTVVLTLSTTISYFLFNNGMTELPDGTLLIGEYGSLWNTNSWQNLAYLYHSKDNGITWNTADFLIKQGVNKHIHIVKYSSLLKSVIMTDGDNRKQLWLNNKLTNFSNKSQWHLINQLHIQTGGYTSMAETTKSTLFGSDYLGGTNFIIDTLDGKLYKKRVLPDPYRYSPVMHMTTRTSPNCTEIWASSYSCLSSEAKSLLMYTKDSGTTWSKVIDFDGTQSEVSIVSACKNGTSSSALYISVNKYNHTLKKYHYGVYKLTTTQKEI